jgi:hypothetical protein
MFIAGLMSPSGKKSWNALSPAFKPCMKLP